MSYNDELYKILNELSINGEEVTDDEGGVPSSPPPDDGENISMDDGEPADAPPDDEPADAPPDDGENISMDDDEPADAPPDDGENISMDDDNESEEGSGEISDVSGGEENESETSEESEGETEEEANNGEEDNTLENIKKIEEELFSSLSPEQIAIKNSELKGQFIELYATIGSTLVRINDIPKSEDNIEILKFITDKLLELQEMVNFNVTVAYQTRTYIENNIIYQQCISTLNAIANIIQNIPKINGEMQDDNENKNEGEPIEDSENDTESNTLDISDASMSDYQEESTSVYNVLF